jgi:hypothetical protein
MNALDNVASPERPSRFHITLRTTQATAAIERKTFAPFINTKLVTLPSLCSFSKLTSSCPPRPNRRHLSAMEVRRGDAAQCAAETCLVRRGDAADRRRFREAIGPLMHSSF